MKTENTRFDDFTKVFNESFGKVTPEQFIKQMEDLGYKFTPTPAPPPSKEVKSAEEILRKHSNVDADSFAHFYDALTAMEEYAQQFQSTPISKPFAHYIKMSLEHDIIQNNASKESWKINKEICQAMDKSNEFLPFLEAFVSMLQAVKGG